MSCVTYPSWAEVDCVPEIPLSIGPKKIRLFLQIQTSNPGDISAVSVHSHLNMPSTSTSVPIGSFMSDTGFMSMLWVESIWLTWPSYTAQDIRSPHKIELKST